MLLKWRQGLLSASNGEDEDDVTPQDIFAYEEADPHQDPTDYVGEAQTTSDAQMIIEAHNQAIADAVAAEREACAEIAEAEPLYDIGGSRSVQNIIARKIRARGELPDDSEEWEVKVREVLEEAERNIPSVFKPLTWPAAEDNPD